MLPGGEAGDPVLGAIRVLACRRARGAEPAIPRERLGHLLVEPHRLQEQVVEIDAADGTQALLVPAEDLRDLLFPRAPRLPPGFDPDPWFFQ